jgi:hypothetical protein
LQLGFLLLGIALVNRVAFAQLPHLPSFGKRKQPTASKDGSGAKNGQPDGPPPAGVPVPMDSPIMQAFTKLQQQSSYHQRMVMSASDPQMQKMMEQMGFGETETITAGDMKQVSMHMQMPIAGKVEDMELRTVVGNGRGAKKWVSPGSTRYLAEVDAKAAKDLGDAEAQAAKSITRSLQMGPMGLASAAVSTGAAAANAAAIGSARKTAHDFFEWTCMDAPGSSAASNPRSEPPPLTDLRVVGDDTIDGVAVTNYEFYVKENGKFQGPMRMAIAKESGLPARMLMSDPHGQGSMRMDYFGFNQGDFEIPACMQK